MHANGQLCNKLNLMPWGCLMAFHSENSDLVSCRKFFSNICSLLCSIGFSCLMYLKPSNQNCLLLHITSSIHQISLCCLHGFIVLMSSGRLVILTEDFIYLFLFIYLLFLFFLAGGVHFNIHCSVVC